MEINKKAFTLIEVLVTALISAFVLTGSGLFIFQTNQFSNDINMNTQVHAAMSIASRMISEDIKKCIEFESTSTGTTDLYLTYIEPITKDEKRVKYYFEANKLMRSEWLASTVDPEMGSEIIRFANVNFTGSFYKNNYDAQIDFNATITHKEKTTSTGIHTFFAKQRNKVKY